MVDTSDGLGENLGYVQHFQFGASLPVDVLGDGVGDNDLVDGGGVDACDRIAAQDAVGEQGIDRGGALLLQELRGSRDGVGGVGQIVDQNTRPFCHITDEHHGGVLSIRDLGWAALLKQKLEPPWRPDSFGPTLWMRAKLRPRLSAMAVARLAPPASGLTMTASLNPGIWRSMYRCKRGLP